jgi:transposase
MEFKHYVGIDVSKRTLDFAVCENGKVIFTTQCENNKKGIGNVIKQLRKLDDFRMTSSVFCMEYTGIYNNHLLEHLISCKGSIWMESAMRIKQSQGLVRGKTDAIDAVRIAEYAFTFRNKVKLWTPPREIVKKLSLLITLRDRLINGKKSFSVPMKENAEFISKELIKKEREYTKSIIASFNRKIEQVEKEIDDIIQSDPQLKHLFNLITSIPGIGSVVATNTIVATDEFKRFNDPNKFSCYAGVAPFEHSSGSSIRGRSRVSHLANKHLKKLYHMAAMAAITFNEELKAYYQRKVTQGKNKMSVLNAIRNKLIHRIFAVVHRGFPYVKNYLNPIV